MWQARRNTLEVLGVQASTANDEKAGSDEDDEEEAGDDDADDGDDAAVGTSGISGVVSSSTRRPKVLSKRLAAHAASARPIVALKKRPSTLPSSRNYYKFDEAATGEAGKPAHETDSKWSRGVSLDRVVKYVQTLFASEIRSFIFA